MEREGPEKTRKLNWRLLRPARFHVVATSPDLQLIHNQNGSNEIPKWGLYRFRRKRKVRSASGSALLCGMFLAGSASAGFFCSTGILCSAMWAQQTDPGKPVVVQPGAPGKPSRTLPASTKATLPARSQADVEFMQGMIMHHAQAVEMTALIPSHTENKDLRLLGARISSSQSD